MTTTFLQQRSAAQSAGFAIIRRILATHSFPDGVTTKQLYKLAVQEPIPQGFQPYPLGIKYPKAPSKPVKQKSSKVVVKEPSYPEHPEHPIRSIRFLKEYILPFLQGMREIKMTPQPRTRPISESELTNKKKKKRDTSIEWVWKVIPPNERMPPPGPPKQKEVVGTEVGVGLDTSHLNKRRQEARVGKVSREVDRLKAYKRFTDVRDPLMERLEGSAEVLERVHKKMEKSPDAGLDVLATEAKKASKAKASKALPRRAPFTPIAGPVLRAKLDAARKQTAYKNQPQDA
ncbi:hypothetical protein JR316_0009945 [Psilocybe cubensis]|uniref:Uncharacterized protein n=2 Tax=Psilocybe cubensis TaxID=181762 RepID=A0A8H7XS63_PSICU|nr:hypothetical protein JR316_0009945 [Psilocybe cubensis]KAH9477719.1 hypothetical protein JR316_0009945 [Psilocybe cubensis]